MILRKLTQYVITYAKFFITKTKHFIFCFEELIIYTFFTVAFSITSLTLKISSKFIYKNLFHYSWRWTQLVVRWICTIICIVTYTLWTMVWPRLYEIRKVFDNICSSQNAFTFQIACYTLWASHVFHLNSRLDDTRIWNRTGNCYLNKIQLLT